MIREDIRTAFRAENPELQDTDILSDTVLNNWLLVGDKEICASIRCILNDYTWTAAEDEQSWDLIEKIPKFYAIDDFPGGGVIFDNGPLDLITIAQLDSEYSTWRTRSSGTPDYYFIRGKTLWFDRPIDSASDIQVYYSAISDDFNSDGITPFNQLSYLEPFHNSLVLYLTYRAKSKIGKPQEAQLAKQEFSNYITWMKKEIVSSRKGVINYEPRC